MRVCGTVVVRYKTMTGVLTAVYLRVPDNAVSLQPFTHYFRVTLCPVSVEFGLRYGLFARHEDGDPNKTRRSCHVAVLDPRRMLLTALVRTRLKQGVSARGMSAL